MTRPATPGLLVTLVGVMVMAGVLAGCASGETTDRTGSPDPAIVEFAETNRVVVDDFEASLLDGSEVSSSRLDGVVTVVNVWGSWCGPCRVEAPVLREVAQQYDDRGVEFLGLSVRDNDAAALAFETRFKIPYDSVTTSDSPRVSLAFGGMLTTAAVPMTIVLDAERRVAARVIGAVTAPTLRALLEPVLDEAEDGNGA